MRRVGIIAGAIVLVIILVTVGIGYMALKDEDSAMDELGALQSQILDIGKEAQDDPSLQQLKQMSVHQHIWRKPDNTPQIGVDVLRQYPNGC